MRLLTSVFLIFFSIGTLKADVVIGNSLAASGSGGFSANAGTVYALDFSTPASGNWKLDNITLFGSGVSGLTFSNNRSWLQHRSAFIDSMVDSCMRQPQHPHARCLL